MMNRKRPLSPMVLTCPTCGGMESVQPIKAHPGQFYCRNCQKRLPLPSTELPRVMKESA